MEYEKSILPHDVSSISVIEEMIYWLQKRKNKNIDNFIVKSFDDNGRVASAEDSWSFKLAVKTPNVEYSVLTISLPTGIKLDSYYKNEANAAMKAIKSAYKTEMGNIASIKFIRDYFL